MIGLRLLAVLLLVMNGCYIFCQQAPYDFGEHTKGERFDELSPAAIAGLSFGVVAIVFGLGVTILFCYYVYKKQKTEQYASGNFLASRAKY